MTNTNPACSGGGKRTPHRLVTKTVRMAFSTKNNGNGHKQVAQGVLSLICCCHFNWTPHRYSQYEAAILRALGAQHQLAAISDEELRGHLVLLRKLLSAL